MSARNLNFSLAFAVLGLVGASGTANAVTFYSASCTGSSTQQVCTFNASVDGNLFISANAVDVNIAGTITSATESITDGAGTATGSTVSTGTGGGSNVDGLGTFTVRDDLTGSPPTADAVTLTINGTNLALAANNDNNTFGAHVCQNGSPGNVCTTTFFATPTQVPAPIVGAGLPGLIAACGGLLALARRRRRQLVV